jgi:hypothetical protein
MSSAKSIDDVPMQMPLLRTELRARFAGARARLLTATASGAALPANAARWHWRAMVALLCALAGSIVWSSLALQSARQQERAAEQRLSLIQSVKSAAGVLAAPATTDFAAQLSAVPSSQRIVEVVQQAAQSSNAQLDSVRLQEQAALPNRLARTDASIELKAPYAAVKAAMGEVLSRLPAATVMRMQWRADPGGASVQVSANLALWGAPLLNAAASAPR